MFVSQKLVGWIIMPVGTLFLYWVVTKKLEAKVLSNYLYAGAIWTLIAVVLDYLFIVKMFNSNAYYKIDVYAYYLITLIFPISIGYFKFRSK
jgi:hypothetical protein